MTTDPDLGVTVINFHAGGLNDGQYRFDDCIDAIAVKRDYCDLIVLCEACEYAWRGGAGTSGRAEPQPNFRRRPPTGRPLGCRPRRRHRHDRSRRDRLQRPRRPRRPGLDHQHRSRQRIRPADETLAEIAKLGPIVAISNVSVLTGPDRMDALHSQLGHHLDGIYASYAIATRKPHPRCWQYAAARHGCTVDDIVHIGDRIPEDIDGALRAGCRGAIFTNTRRINVPDYLSTDPRVAIVPDLRGALSVAQQWYRACRDRVARDQRPDAARRAGAGRIK